MSLSDAAATLVQAPTVFYTVDGPVTHNPCSAAVLRAMKSLLRKPEHSNITCLIFERLEDVKVPHDSVAIGDDYCKGHFIYIAAANDWRRKPLPVWASLSKWYLVVGPKCGKASNRVAHCARNTLAIFTTRFALETGRGNHPWGQKKTVFKRKRSRGGHHYWPSSGSRASFAL